MTQSSAVRVCIVGDNQLVRVVNEFLPKGKLEVQFSKDLGLDTLVFKSHNVNVIKRLVEKVGEDARSKMNGIQREIMGSRRIYSISYSLSQKDFFELKTFTNKFKFKNLFALRKFKKNLKQACPSAEQLKWLENYFKRS